ncbi:MAG: TetR/AcrR family transcriptional regulator [Dehalococcoidia bacterium]
MPVTLASRPGRLEERKARTRAAIISAAAELFTELGFERTSIQLIAERASTGLGTVYGYFGSKEELLTAVVRARSEHELDRFRAGLVIGTPTPELIIAVLERVRTYAEENRPILLAAIGTRLPAATEAEEIGGWVVQAFRLLLQLGIDRGEIRPLPADTTARMLTSMALACGIGMGAWPSPAGAERVSAEMKQIVRAMLGT